MPTSSEPSREPELAPPGEPYWLAHDPMEALRASEERFRAIFTAAPVGIALIDREGRYLAVNPARQRMLGYSEAELLGRHYLEITHPDDVASDLALNQEARASGRDTYTFEKRFVRGSGEILWARMTIAHIIDAQGEVMYSVSISEDITGQKQSEEERARLLEAERLARERMERLAAEREAILTQLGEGIVLADPQGHITFMNQAALRLYGLEGSPFPHGSTQPLSSGGTITSPEEHDLWHAAVQGSIVPEREWRVRRADGTEVMVQGSARPLVAADGKGLGAVLSLRDVTHRYDLERQKDDFLSALAHDLRTPLTTVKGRAQMLQRRARKGAIPLEQLTGDLERIEAGASRMMTLINELLDVANIQIGRPLKLERAPADLVALGRSVVADHASVAGKHVMTLVDCYS